MQLHKKYRGPRPCGSRRAYEKCCQTYHEGAIPIDAESLMRSRYTAYVLKLEDYLLETWHSRTRPAGLDLAASPRRWMGLKVLRHEALTEDAAIVEFIAYYKSSGRVREMREESRFVREDGRWFYAAAGGAGGNEAPDAPQDV